VYELTAPCSEQWHPSQNRGLTIFQKGVEGQSVEEEGTEGACTLQIPPAEQEGQLTMQSPPRKSGITSLST